MYFLCKLICSTGITKCIFVNRLYDDTILFISNKGFIPEICTILSKYDLTKYFLTYVYGGQFPTRMCCKAIVKQAVASHERDKCHTIISDKADVPRFLRIMTNRLYQKSFPFYVIAMKDCKYPKLLKFAKLACLPINDVTNFKLCSNEFTYVVMLIVMECSDLNDCRNRLWDDITNSLGVVLAVDLWSRSDSDILIIMLGAHWGPLRVTATRCEFYTVLIQHVDIFFAAVQKHITWLR
jgi:hypothetical protein